VKLTNSIRLTTLILISLLSALVTSGQSGVTPPIGLPMARQMPIAMGNNLYCAGFIQSNAISTENRIFGANDEADRFVYSQNDLVLISMGRNKSVNVGDIYSVVRPRGAVKSKWTNKSNIGFYVQEIGALEVTDVKGEHAIARVKVSCDNLLLGDLVQIREQRSTPLFTQRPQLDIFQDPSGKASGRILMGRDGAEMLSRDFIAYVDLGADNNVQVGDRLTIYRELGKGNLTKKPENESVSSRNNGFPSDVYKGGNFSNQSGRKSGEYATGSEVTTKTAKQGRPPNLRKIVGEAVIINVKERTATIVITRTAQEIHTGDHVEVQ
jgi:hypothetical protein